MKFTLYCFFVSSVSWQGPGSIWRDFWGQFSKIWRLGDIFWGKMNVSEISCSKSLWPIVTEILENAPEPLATLQMFHAKVPYKQRRDTADVCCCLKRMLKSSELLSQCLFSCGICRIALSVDSIIVNYSCRKCFYVPEISSIKLETWTSLLTFSYTNP